MITIKELKEELGKFPDTYLVSAFEDDESNYLGVFTRVCQTPNQLALTLAPEPIGYIGTQIWGDSAVFVGDGVEAIGENNTTKEENP